MSDLRHFYYDECEAQELHSLIGKRFYCRIKGEEYEYSDSREKRNKSSTGQYLGRGKFSRAA